MINFEPEITKKMTLHAKKSIKEAENIAAHYGCSTIRPEHLLFAVFVEDGSMGSIILKNLGVKREHFNQLLTSKQNHEEKSSISKETSIKLSPLLKSIITNAYSLANSFDYPYVGTEHLAYSILKSNEEIIQKIIHKSSVMKKENSPNIQISNILQGIFKNDSFPNLSKIFDLPEITLSKKNPSSTTPFLDQFCVNLNEEAMKKDDTIIGREKELERITNILGRKTKNNPVLIGDPGVGKTVLVSGLAKKIQTGDVPQTLQNKKILTLDIALLVAGTSFRGEFENRLKEVIREIKENPDIILFIDEIHNIVGAGNTSGGLDAANILKPPLSKGDIRCIGATTREEYKKHIEKDAALERRFQPITVNEPTPDETKKILIGIKNSYEKFHNVIISEDAIESAVNLSVRYIQDRFLPDKAIDIIDETASAIRNKNMTSDLFKKIGSLERKRETIVKEKNQFVNEEKYEEAMLLRQKESVLSQKIAALKNTKEKLEKEITITVSAEEIAKTLSYISGIPLEKITSGVSINKIKNLKKILNDNVIGQEQAIEKIADVIMRSYSGISNPNRPLGSFLFLGPTGVGKTLAAKMLAQSIFESEKNLVRIDMSEFMERHNISRLIGAPAGYIGYEEGGKLTETIRHNPYSLILFDEIEKAHPDVFNLLLQILEEGMLTDAEGRQVNFRNTIIILTSNLGTSEFTSSAKMGFQEKEKTRFSRSFKDIQNYCLSELKKQMKPELINRLDHIIVFNPLGKKEIEKITLLETIKLEERLKKNGFSLSHDSSVIDFLAGFSLDFDQGARLVRKNVQELLENAIAKKIVGGKITNMTIHVQIKEGKIILT